jgi:bacterioferritin-associated ferredoxin
MTDNEHCEMVKQGRADAQDFDDFLAHVNDCKDCQRRIRSQIIVNFRQRQTERKNGD